MKCDVILAGVGGQGVLSVSAIIARTAAREGLEVKQSEVHGMAQRGGAVLAHLRLAEGQIYSDLIPEGGADMVLSMEPLESLRYLSYLDPEGELLTAAEPVRNIPDYPDLEGLLARIRSLPHAGVVDADALARKTATQRAVNVVMVGAASHGLPLSPESLEQTIREAFKKKGPEVVEANIRAFRAGREVIQ